MIIGSITNYIIRSFIVCSLLLQCSSYHFQVNNDVIKQGECHKLSLKILEACQQVCPSVTLGPFNPYAGICSRLLRAIAYVFNPSFYDVVPLKDY